MSKKKDDKNQSYSGTSIVSQLLSDTKIGKLLGYGDNTYTDGYGTTRTNASLGESANGQQLERMGETAKDVAGLVATGAAFGNPITASNWAAPLITAAQAYYMGYGLNDASDRVESMIEDPSQRTAENALITGLEILPVIPAVKTVVKGAKEVVPAAKQIVKEAEAVNYAGRQADANNAREALTSGKTRIKVGDVEINNPELNYRQVGSGVARDFVKTGNQFAKNPYNRDEDKLLYLIHEPLGNPMYKSGSLWYGIENTGSYPDLLVTAEPMSYANKYGLVSSIDKGGRRIPATTLNSNNTGAYVFEPGYGYRKVEANPEISVSLPYNLNADGTINWPVVENQFFSEKL